MGTMIQRLRLSEADFRGDRFADWPVDLAGNNDLLTLSSRKSSRRFTASTSKRAPT